MSRDQNAGQNGNIQIGNKSFETVVEFKYLVTTLTYQNCIKSRLKSGNACYHSVQNLLSSSLLSKSVKIKIYRTIILLVVLYGCETWSLTWREECRLRFIFTCSIPCNETNFFCVSNTNKCTMRIYIYI